MTCAPRGCECYSNQNLSRGHDEMSDATSDVTCDVMSNVRIDEAVARIYSQVCMDSGCNWQQVLELNTIVRG